MVALYLKKKDSKINIFIMLPSLLSSYLFLIVFLYFFFDFFETGSVKWSGVTEPKTTTTAGS